jgi:hypothetical protein
MDRVFETSGWIAYVQSAAFAGGVLEFIGYIGGLVDRLDVPERSHNEHIHHLITNHYTCTPLSMCHVESRSSLHWLMYTCLHRAKSYALFQIIGAFRSAEVGLPSPTGHLPVIAFAEKHRQMYYLLITLPSKLPPGPYLNGSAQFQSFSRAFRYLFPRN